MPAQHVQEMTRLLFERWGLPERIGVDNGTPWASWSDVPTALALWWIGLGIGVIFNHVHCPKENAFVERCNGLAHFRVPSRQLPNANACCSLWRRQRRR